jgi:hypothetical protein
MNALPSASGDLLFFNSKRRSEPLKIHEWRIGADGNQLIYIPPYSCFVWPFAGRIIEVIYRDSSKK